MFGTRFSLPTPSMRRGKDIINYLASSSSIYIILIICKELLKSTRVYNLLLVPGRPKLNPGNFCIKLLFFRNEEKIQLKINTVNYNLNSYTFYF